MIDQRLAWTLLTSAVGSYRGSGQNHENQNFTGNLNLAFVFDKKVLSLTSTAHGDDSEIFHQEYSWIGVDITGTLTLYVSSNNHPGITPHFFHRIEKTHDGQMTIFFRFGNLDDKNSFREEISLSFFPDKSIEHFYWWGLPGGEFKKRSGSRVEKL